VIGRATVIEPIRDHWVIVGAVVVLIVALVIWWRGIR
jgi:hypothetical protein